MTKPTLEKKKLKNIPAKKHRKSSQPYATQNLTPFPQLNFDELSLGNVKLARPDQPNPIVLYHKRLEKNGIYGASMFQENKP